MAKVIHWNNLLKSQLESTGSLCRVQSILKYAKRLIHIDLCPVAIHRFQKSANKKKDKLIKKNIIVSLLTRCELNNQYFRLSVSQSCWCKCWLCSSLGAALIHLQVSAYSLPMNELINNDWCYSRLNYRENRAWSTRQNWWFWFVQIPDYSIPNWNDMEISW